MEKGFQKIITNLLKPLLTLKNWNFLFQFFVPLVVSTGIEPVTHGFSVRCSTN